MKRTFALLIGIVAVVMTGGKIRAQVGPDRLEVKVTPAMKEFCHIIQFPQGWQYQRFDKNGQPLFFDYGAEYEFRQEGLLSTQFLVGGYEKMVGRRYDAGNWYKVDLSNPKAPVLPASRKAWDAGTVVPLTRRSIFPPTTLKEDQQAEINGFQLNKSGNLWIQSAEDAARLSPDQAWAVLQSMSGTQPFRAEVFFDIFNAETGQKVFTIQGTYSGRGNDPEGYLGTTAWVTERYFVVQLGVHKERCLVCVFGGHGQRQGAKP